MIARIARAASPFLVGFAMALWLPLGLAVLIALGMYLATCAWLFVGVARRCGTRGRYLWALALLCVLWPVTPLIAKWLERQETS